MLSMESKWTARITRWSSLIFRPVVTFILTDSDVSEVTKDDLSFASDFVIQAVRKDMVHALVVHWDCEFSHCHTPIGFSTAPSAPYTHWKQTVFYLEQDLHIQPGDKIEGRFEMKVVKSFYVKSSFNF